MHTKTNTGREPKKMIRKLAAVAALVAIALGLLALAGCEKQAETTTRAGVDFEVDKLFTIEGCTVFRFFDAGNFRYFTNCSGSTQWSESCGKNCTQDVGVEGGAP